MKKWLLFGCILIAVGVAFFLMRSALKPKAGDLPAGPEATGTGSLERIQPSPVKTAAPADLLARAYEMAAFIEQMCNSVPSERDVTRNQLKALQALFFVSDYVMTAKTNAALVLSADAIINAFTNVSPDTSFIRSRLANYAERPGTLSDHYQSISENAEAKDQIKAIKAALAENGLPINTESDLLMDCIRYSGTITEIYEMYGPNPRRVQEATPYAPALTALVNASDTVFRHRFTEKFGLEPRTTTNLMSRLKAVRIFGLTPAEFEIPARLR